HESAKYSAVLERIGEEAKRFVVMFVYLWLILGLFMLLEFVSMRKAGQHFAWSFGFALFNALILAKVMLVAEELKLGEKLRARPLILPILFESALMAVLFIAFHVAEKVFLGLFKGETISASVPHVGGGGIVGVVCVGLILFVSMIPFFGFRRVARELEP